MDVDEKPERRTTFTSVDEIVRESLVNLSENTAEENIKDKESNNKCNSDVVKKETCKPESLDDTRNKTKVNPLDDALEVSMFLNLD